jgi:hypothetical protein
MNGTRTVANVTTNTFDITVSVSQTVTSQAVSSGKLIKPQAVSLSVGAYTASFGPSGAFNFLRGI